MVVLKVFSGHWQQRNGESGAWKRESFAQANKQNPSFVLSSDHSSKSLARLPGQKGNQRQVSLYVSFFLIENRRIL